MKLQTFISKELFDGGLGKTTVVQNVLISGSTVALTLDHKDGSRSTFNLILDKNDIANIVSRLSGQEESDPKVETKYKGKL